MILLSFHLKIYRCIKQFGLNLTSHFALFIYIHYIKTQRAIHSYSTSYIFLYSLPLHAMIFSSLFGYSINFVHSSRVGSEVTTLVKPPQSGENGEVRLSRLAGPVPLKALKVLSDWLDFIFRLLILIHK